MAYPVNTPFSLPEMWWSRQQWTESVFPRKPPAHFLVNGTVSWLTQSACEGQINRCWLGLTTLLQQFSFSLLASIQSLLITRVCSTHLWNPGMPAFCKDVSVYMLSTKYPEIHFASTAMKSPLPRYSKLVDFLQFFFSFTKLNKLRVHFFFLKKDFKNNYMPPKCKNDI